VRRGAIPRAEGVFRPGELDNKCGGMRVTLVCLYSPYDWSRVAPRIATLYEEELAA
jgi:hypothetical protein